MTGRIIFSGWTWLGPVLGATALLAMALIWAGLRTPAEKRVRIGCGLLKFAGIAALAVCLLDPLRVGHRARPGANIFAVIADNSQGLQVKDVGASRSRGDLLRAALTGPGSGWLSALEQNFQVRRYTFDTRLQNSRDFGELNFSGRASALGTALQTAREHWRGQPVAGVLLLTDGIATDISGDLPPLDGCPPIYPVVMGEDTDIRDVSLKKVGVSQTAFEDAPVTVQADVGALGFPGAAIDTRLTELGVVTAPAATNAAGAVIRIAAASNLVAQSVQRAAGANADLNFRFQIHPDGPGLHFYELDTGVREEATGAGSGEATLANNRRVIVVDRGEKPFRVLYVSGRPNWEYKFLNRAIQEDSQVQMVALIRAARREAKFDFKGRAGESSNPLFRGFDLKDEEAARYDQPVIIRLNTKDEFELRGGFPKTAEELYRYDAVILGDVESEFFTHEQMALLQQFVSERGGGFLMLGGAESFREGNYAGTPIAALLPVYVDRPAPARLPNEFRLTLTREGWLQPWTRLRPTEAEESTRLAATPPFEVLNPVGDIKPGASVLATVSDPVGATYPALVVQHFGLGRSAALQIGDLWRWGMKDESMQKDLGKAWRQLVRWLVADVPARISVTANPSVAGNPAEVQLSVKVRDNQFKPLDNASVQLTVRPIRWESQDAKMAPTNYVQLAAEPSSSRPGTYDTVFVARDSGAYVVDALVTRADGTVAGRAATGWTSDPAAEEFRSLMPNRALLEQLAKRTGGEIVALGNLDGFVRGLPERHAPIAETWTYPVWHQPLVFLFALGCFVVEWGIRRWKGLP